MNEIAKLGKKVYYIKEFNQIANFIRKNTINNDIVITQGAGTITKLGNMIINQENH